MAEGALRGTQAALAEMECRTALERGQTKHTVAVAVVGLVAEAATGAPGEAQKVATKAAAVVPAAVASAVAVAVASPFFLLVLAGRAVQALLLFATGFLDMTKQRGLYDNIHAKRKRIKAGSGEKMRKPGTKGAPTDKNFKQAAKTRKK